jgi:hypothetical protein
LLGFSVFAGKSKHIHDIEALTMTSLRGSSIRVIVKSTGGVECECGDAELRRAVSCRRWRWHGFSKAAIFSAGSVALLYFLQWTRGALEHDNSSDNNIASSPRDVDV